MIRLLLLFVLVAAAFASVLVQSSRAADDTVISFVHGQERIDIPASAIRRITAKASETYAIKGTRERLTFSSPRVEVCFTKPIRDRICRLTQHIVEEPLEVIVDCKIVASPIVREPLCTQPCFQLTASDLAEAQALADSLRNRAKTACPPAP